jgi:hypothetical protein
MRVGLKPRRTALCAGPKSPACKSQASGKKQQKSNLNIDEKNFHKYVDVTATHRYHCPNADVKSRSGETAISLMLASKDRTKI